MSYGNSTSLLHTFSEDDLLSALLALGIIAGVVVVLVAVACRCGWCACEGNDLDDAVRGVWGMGAGDAAPVPANINREVRGFLDMGARDPVAAVPGHVYTARGVWGMGVVDPVAIGEGGAAAVEMRGTPVTGTEVFPQEPPTLPGAVLPSSRLSVIGAMSAHPFATRHSSGGGAVIYGENTGPDGSN